jgi:hypothetical protein
MHSTFTLGGQIISDQLQTRLDLWELISMYLQYLVIVLARTLRVQKHGACVPCITIAIFSRSLVQYTTNIHI